MEEAESKVPETQTRFQIQVSIVVGAVIAGVSAILYLIMPGLVLQGGMVSTQADFLRLSPIFFPRLTFLLLGTLGLSFMVSSVRKLPSAARDGAILEEGATPRICFMYAVAVVYPFILPWLGYGLTSALLMAVLTFFLGTRAWWQVIAFGALVPITIRFIFERLLSISLPRSYFEGIDAAEEFIMRALVYVFL